MAWIELVIGVLILVSPWALGMGQAVITWTNAVFGVALILVGIWNIMIRKAGRKEIQ